MISGSPDGWTASWTSVCGKNSNVAIFSDTIDMIIGNFDGSTHRALSIHTTFSDLDLFQGCRSAKQF